MVSVIAPAYNNPEEVDLFLQSIAQRLSGDFEVIVVDDGSRDMRLGDVCAKYAFTRYLRLPENRGAPTARNAGAQLARGEVLLFLDSDMIVQADLSTITSRLFADSTILAAVGAFDPKPANPSYFRNFWGLVKAFSLPRESYSSTFYPAVGAIRKAVFDEVGGFNKNIKGASIEDFEFSIRFSARGWQVRYAPELLVSVHYKGMVTSLRQSFDRSTKWSLLFRERRQFDNHTTTGWQALGAICGAAVVTFAPLLFLDRRVAILVGVLGIGYFAANGPFFRYVSRVAGPAFLPAAVVFHLLLSVTVTLGAVRALLYAPLSEKRRRAMIYR
jgi:glycosyltransferase involved in cell wall biosynthesis